SMDLPDELEERSFGDLRRNVISWVIFFLAIGGFVAGAAYISGQEELKVQIQLLFTEGLVAHKKSHIIERRERYQKEDKYAQNRYGEFRMIYSPRDAEVQVTQIKYVETIGEFMTRYVTGGEDTRKKVEEVELKKFREKTTNLKEKTVVSEQAIKDLPVTQRTNPENKPGDPVACTESVDDFCTYVYKVKISKEKYRPREFVIYSEYSLDAPDTVIDPKAQALLFKGVGPGINEVNWPGADLQPTPELFQEQFVRLWTNRIKCNLSPEDYAVFELVDVPKKANAKKYYAAFRALPEDEMYQKMVENGHLQYGGLQAKSWTLTEWKSSVAELKQHPLLWNNASEAIDNCDCDAEGNPKACWQRLVAPTVPAPE
ncbi:MAG: hypothetical protein ACI9OJ_002978, partial [Myxococcota bacterium]